MYHRFFELIWLLVGEVVKRLNNQINMFKVGFLISSGVARNDLTKISLGVVAVFLFVLKFEEQLLHLVI
jgi:hypothetical protein